jgi:hypothetical protein
MFLYIVQTVFIKKDDGISIVSENLNIINDRFLLVDL